MTRGLSIWLDALRVWATILVVMSHVAYSRFTRGDYSFVRDLNLGSDAVIVFFVISGLVIAYAAERDGRLSTYTFNRVTRLLSVLVPALLLTFVLDQWGQSIGPEAYQNKFYNPLGLHDLLLRGVSMTNEWGALERIRLGTNGPLWSLSYEAAYYILFAIVMFTAGLRRWLFLGLCVGLVGPRILLLMPAWLMGVCIWRWLARGGANTLNANIARAMAWAGPLLYVACLWAGAPDALRAVTADVFAPQNYRSVLAFSDEFIWNAFVGLFAAVHVMGMARLLNAYSGTHDRIRWWAGASFSIYVVHYPMLHFIDAAVPAETLARDALLLVGSIAAGVLFAQVFERKIGGLRQCLRAAWQKLPVSGRRLRPVRPLP